MKGATLHRCAARPPGRLAVQLAGAKARPRAPSSGAPIRARAHSAPRTVVPPGGGAGGRVRSLGAKPEPRRSSKSPALGPSRGGCGAGKVLTDTGFVGGSGGVSRVPRSWVSPPAAAPLLARAGVAPGLRCFLLFCRGAPGGCPPHPLWNGALVAHSAAGDGASSLRGARHPGGSAVGRSPLAAAVCVCVPRS